MDNNGYIKLYRSITEWEWFKDPNTLTLWIYLLAEANWKTGHFQGIEVPPGALIRSLEHIAEDTGMTVKMVRTALDHLEKSKNVARKRAGKSMLIIVENWGRFQSDAPTKGHNKGQREGNVRATRGQQEGTDRRRGRREEGKKCKNAYCREESIADDEVSASIREKQQDIRKKIAALNEEIRKRDINEL